MRLSILSFSLFLIANVTFSQKKEEKKFSIDTKVIPYISYNKTYEFMFGAAPMVMYKTNKKDTISPPSISAAIGMYTTNKSWFTAVFSKMYFNEDKWRVLLGAGIGTINAQFLQSAVVNDFINYQSGANFFKLQVQRKIGENLYLGGNYLYTKFDNTYETEVPTEEEKVLNGLGIAFLWDKRDNVYYPTKGHKLNLDLASFPGFMGNNDVSNKITIKYNKYITKGKLNNIWVFRTFGGFGIGDVIFNNLLVMGGTDLRGYTKGEYRGKQLLAVQTEYRYNLKENMGLVAFGGFGSVLESNIESNNGEILPSIGIGYRYMAFPKYKMRVGIDVAAGKDDWGIYFRIGESF
jgi:hypothetical protein